MPEAADRSSSDEVVVRRADRRDLDVVVAIEAESFPTPWSRSLLSREFDQPGSIYLVAEIDGVVVGFIGLWHVLDEGHICTLAVDRGHRGRGLGELLVLAALNVAVHLGSDAVHLEYRVGNEAAGRLYAKLGFEQIGLRPKYYSDTDEDAVLARVSGLSGSEGRALLRESWERWESERSLQVATE